MRIAVSAIVLAAAAGSASAAIETFSAPFSSGVPNVVPGITVTLPKFDTMGGTRVLTAVEISGTGTLQAGIIGINDAAAASTLTVDLSGTLVLLAPGAILLSNFSQSATSPLLNPGDSHDFGIVSDTDPLGPSAGSPLASYTGMAGDTFNVTGTVTGGFTISGAGNATLQIQNFGASGEVVVKYTYEVIPTPGAAALLGLGGLAMTRRRR